MLVNLSFDSGIFLVWRVQISSSNSPQDGYYRLVLLMYEFCVPFNPFTAPNSPNCQFPMVGSREFAHPSPSASFCWPNPLLRPISPSLWHSPRVKHLRIVCAHLCFCGALCTRFALCFCRCSLRSPKGTMDTFCPSSVAS